VGDDELARERGRTVGALLSPPGWCNDHRIESGPRQLYLRLGPNRFCSSSSNTFVFLFALVSVNDCTIFFSYISYGVQSSKAVKTLEMK